jgi:hypothetical protein
MTMLAVVLLTFTVAQVPAAPAAQPTLTRDEMAVFLKSAKVIRAKVISKGITAPVRLTLSDGRVTHDAAFQAVDEHKASMEFAGGRRELNFIDSWRYNMAAFQLAELLGIGDMMPVTVERKWQGKNGALTWWIDKLMDEDDRYKKKIQAPDSEAWNRQMFRLRIFSQLVSDSDRNLGNVIITPEWKVMMIDFTRAFRLWATIKEAEITRCDRRLLESLQGLTSEALSQATKGYLTGSEVKGVMSRRDLIVAHVKKLVAEKGEAAVLY